MSFAKRNSKRSNPASSSASSGGKRGRETLEEQLHDDRFAKQKINKSRGKAEERSDKRSKKDDYVSEALSKKILLQAREQQEEEEEEDMKQRKSKKGGKSSSDYEHENRYDFDEEEDEDEEGVRQEDIEEFEQFEEIELEEEDERVLDMFMSKSSDQPKKLLLADLILEKIREKEQQQRQDEDMSPEQELEAKFDPKVVQVYKSVGKILKTYTSGKIPKAFKIIPALNNWEEVLYFTNPDEWSAPSMYQATRLFASNLNSRMAQRFYNLILLPRVRNDFAEHKKLNFHLYMSLKKALFKPAAFYKGIILPICAERSCTLREAAVLASVMQKVSIPVLHSAAALLKLGQMEYFGPNSLFIRVLLDKKYSLPMKVIDALVTHYTRFVSDERSLPVLWHQSLLAFVQRYKMDLGPDHKEQLKLLLRQHTHPLITEEIRRELASTSKNVDTNPEKMSI